MNETQDPKVRIWQLLRELRDAIKEATPNDRSDTDRAYHVLYTQLEIMTSYFLIWCKGSD